ncbi:DUF2818 family protein [Aquabacterium humicola]|uniref:DUF2818 family protein n=1 Tax=Aquabacterium humicola TaxID=3237377 RepID=UPI0025429D30|nr:DUF2818 family protein [Rubrivivax pictus]
MTASIWLLLGFGFVAANLPFLSERVLLVGPRPAHKSFWWRLLELLLLAGLTIAIGTAIEARIGQRHPQGWQFYAIALCLFATFAFPGFVWRHLRRHRPQ